MKRLLYFLSALPLLTGCYEDKSSDKYDPIGSITIEGIEAEYDVITFIDELKITPKITSTDPNDKPETFEYLWTIYPNSSADNPPPPDTLVQGVGAKDLEYLVDVRPARYTVQLRATNPANGYTVFATATLIVNTQFTTGYYFLKETAEGNTELDFLHPAGETAPNLIEGQTGASIAGAPTKLGYFVHYSYMDQETGEFIYCRALVPMGGNDMKIMKIEDMSLIYDHSTMFYGEDGHAEKPVMAFNDLFSRPWYVADKGVYLSNQMPDPMSQDYGTGLFGLPLNVEGGVSLSRHCIVGGNTMLNFYDEKNGRLIYYNYNGALQTMSSDNGYSPTGINHTLLFMGTNGWAVFQDKADSQIRYLYKLNTSSGRNPITSVAAIDPTLNFGKAQVYGSNKSGATAMLYAGVGDKLYMYNTAFDAEANPDGSPETLLSTRGMGAGEEITMITHKSNAPSTYLMIATHKDGKYKIYMYTLSGGAPSGDPVVTASGDGKVVDVQYASPSLSSFYNVNY